MREKPKVRVVGLCSNCKAEVAEYRGYPGVLYHVRTGSAYCAPDSVPPRKFAERGGR